MDPSGAPGDNRFAGVMPAATPVTHVPTLPPRGPRALRYLGVVVVVACGAVLVVVLSLAAFSPKRSPAKPALSTPSTTATASLAGQPASADAAPSSSSSSSSSSSPAPEPLDDLAPVPISLGPVDARQACERSLKRRGLRDGDAPALDRAIERATALERARRDVDAFDAWRAAQTLADKVPIDRGFVFSKQKRLRVALESRGARDGRKADELMGEVDRRFAGRDYAGANDALNRGFALLK